jgi:ADP-ribose pyrophosphatase
MAVPTGRSAADDFPTADPVGEPTEQGRIASDHFSRASDELVHQGSVVAFRRLVIEDRQGQQFGRDLIAHPGAVAVVPLDGTDVILVQQYRASIDADMLEIPAGKRDEPGEPPIETAHRELAEEIGMSAGRMEPLLNVHHSPGFCDEYGHIFLARDLEATDLRRQGPEEQAMSIHRVALAEAVQWCLGGLITDAKTVSALLATAHVVGLSAAADGVGSDG